MPALKQQKSHEIVLKCASLWPDQVVESVEGVEYLTVDCGIFYRRRKVVHFLGDIVKRNLSYTDITFSGGARWLNGLFETSSATSDNAEIALLSFLIH